METVYINLPSAVTLVWIFGVAIHDVSSSMSTWILESVSSTKVDVVKSKLSLCIVLSSSISNLGSTVFFGVLVNRGAHNSEGVSSSNISKEYGSFWRSTSDEFDVLLNAFPLTDSRSETPRFSPLLFTNDSPKTWIDVLPAGDVPRFPSSLFSTLVSETSVSIVGRSFWEYGISFEYVLTT